MRLQGYIIYKEDKEKLKEHVEKLLQNPELIFPDPSRTEKPDGEILNPIRKQFVKGPLRTLFDNPITKYFYSAFQNYIENPAKVNFGPFFENVVYKPCKRLGYKPVERLFETFVSMYFERDIEGKEKMPNEGRVILATNHRSFLDPILLGLSVDRKPVFMAGEKLYEIPLAKQFLDFTDAIKIHRGDKDLDAIKECRNVLKNERLLCIYPEGAIPGGEPEHPKDMVREETGLLPGYPGTVKLAIQTDSPVVPVGMVGQGEALPVDAVPHMREPPIPDPSEIVIRFGDPIKYGPEEKEKSADDLTEDLMFKISELVEKAEEAHPSLD